MNEKGAAQKCPSCGQGAIFPGAMICSNCGIPIFRTEEYTDGQLGRLTLKVFGFPRELIQLYNLKASRTGIEFDVLQGDLTEVEIMNLAGKRFAIYMASGQTPFHLCPIIFFGVTDEVIVTIDSDGPIINIQSIDHTAGFFKNIALAP